MNNTIYSSLFTTKDNSIIPVLQNGKTIESRYSPINEAIKKLSIINKETNFFIIIGLGSGILIQQLLVLNPNAQLLVIESSEEDFTFLSQIPLVNKFLKNKQIIFCNITNLYKTFIETYIPSFYGNFEIIENQIWAIENKESYNKIKKILEIAIGDIKLDFSVQSHFGKIWQKNIINNLKLLQKQNFDINICARNKKAIIIGAGPSLDKNIELLKTQNDYCIIATDTAYSTLQENNIFCDYVICIDGQNISHNHFFIKSLSNKKTTFIFDLSANSSTVKHLIDLGFNVFFSINNHPFSKYINQLYNNCFLELYTGSGTVTIAALDFAIKCGFSQIQFFGADFSYIDYKPYTKGTYLDTLYSIKENKLINMEKQFISLMYRTPVTKLCKNIITTELLQKYEESFLLYLKTQKLSYNKKNNIYYINNTASNCEFTDKQKLICPNVNLSVLKEYFIQNFNQIPQKNTIFCLNSLDICFLPLISWLRNNDDIIRPFSKYLEKAYNYILRIL